MLKWFWENISNINSVIDIFSKLIGGIIFVAGVFIGFFRLKLTRNQFQHLNLVIDNETKKSMKYYVPTRGQELDPCDENVGWADSILLIPHFIKQIFRESETQYYIILADSGMGKTTFALKLFSEYYKKIFRKYNIVLIPLALESSIEKIKEVKDKPDTILLLDGFDEDQYAVEDYNKRLKDICNETELFYKVIMTCRTQFFPDSDSEPKHTGKIRFGVGKKNVEFSKYYLSPFNDREIDLYLKKKYSSIFQKEKMIRSRKLIYNCPDLMVRPMLLNYIDDLLIDLTKNYDYVSEIYSELVFRWVERETVDNEILYDFSEKIAEYMYYNKTVYIKGSEIENFCKEYKIQLRSIEAKSRSLLNRNANGDYKFVHKSILEFFLAEKALKDVKFRGIIMSKDLKGYDMVGLFFKEKCQTYFGQLQQADEHSKALNFKNIDFSYFVFKELMIEDCDFSMCNMQGADFRRASIDHVNFMNADLSKALFSHTDLRKANLAGAKFVNARLNGADLYGADLTNADFTGADLDSTDLSNTICKNAIFDKGQIDSLGMRFDFRGANVYIDKNRMISYEEYCREKNAEVKSSRSSSAHFFRDLKEDFVSSMA